MLYHSQPFLLLFLPAFLVALLATRTPEGRQWVIVLFSLAFYGLGDLRFLPWLIASVALNWLWVRQLVMRGIPGAALCAVAANLALIGVFKYAGFFSEALTALTGAQFPQVSLVLPIGISFFTFQQIAYVLDAKAGRIAPGGFREYAAYITFFPQLIAGPIVRHDELVPQLRRMPDPDRIWEAAGRGGVLFLIGLTKKVAIADTLAPLADAAFGAANGGDLSSGTAWLGLAAFTLQIYYDFSGYSDMAIGLGLMAGYRLPVNFDRPYAAASLRDFWNRWHMTLGRFLRDYLYIPLGGNRHGGARQMAALATTMLLCGLWHGAGWTFIAWGALHGLGLGVNAAWRAAGGRMPALVGWMLTIAFVTLGWVLFRAESFAAAQAVYSALAGIGVSAAMIGGATEGQWLALFLGALAAVLGPSSHHFALDLVRPAPVLSAGGAVFAVTLVLAVGAGNAPSFIYFQF